MAEDKRQLIKDKDPREEKIQLLQENFPGVVEEDEETGGYNINADKLQQILDPSKTKIVEDGYELRWVGKKVAYDDVSRPNRKLLRPLYKDSKNFKDTNNILIKGDNLDALKILHRNYFNKIKMIYIDPPYNTASDEFVYKDNFTESEAIILDKLDYPEEDKEYIKNLWESKTHSGWLTFMYPRLLLAKDLLKDDGIIFISIDENEQANLKLICDEIFGASNLINTFVWLNNLKGRQISNHGASKTYEYVLAYGKNIEHINQWSITLKESAKYPNAYKKNDYDLLEDDFGTFVIKNELHNTNKKYDEITRSNLTFYIHYNPVSGDIKFSPIHSSTKYADYIRVKPPKNKNNRYQAWRWSKEKIQKDTKDLYFVKKDAGIKIYTKVRDHNKTRFKDIITNISNGVRDLEKLKMHSFSFPKPVNLINILAKISTSNEDLIMDFFAGSGTTAQAVMELNEDDGGNRKFILVQLDEEISANQQGAIKFLDSIKKPANIFEICAERIRRAGENIKKKVVDTGFKIFEIINDDANRIYDVPLNKIKQGELEMPQNNEVDDLLYSFMAADGIALDEKVNCIKEASLFIVHNTAYVFAKIELSELENIKDNHPMVEHLSVYSPNIPSDNFMLKLEDHALNVGFEKGKIRIIV